MFELFLSVCLYTNDYGQSVKHIYHISVDKSVSNQILRIKIKCIKKVFVYLQSVDSMLIINNFTYEEFRFETANP